MSFSTYIFLLKFSIVLMHSRLLIIFSQTKLVNVAESISNKLSYFTELDRVGSRLNSATLSVTSDSFVATLARLDECISFIEKHVSTSCIFFTVYTLLLVCRTHELSVCFQK